MLDIKSHIKLVLYCSPSALVPELLLHMRAIIRAMTSREIKQNNGQFEFVRLATSTSNRLATCKHQ